MRVCACVYMRVYMYLRTCMCVCVHTCTCIHVCTCVRDVAHRGLMLEYVFKTAIQLRMHISKVMSFILLHTNSGKTDTKRLVHTHMHIHTHIYTHTI